MPTFNDTIASSKVQIGESVRKDVAPELVEEIVRALRSVRGWGSIEIHVQDFNVTQITTRNIRKTKHILAE